MLPADIVVIAIGVRPNTALAETAGLSIDRGILVDDAMTTSDPAIFAIGECAQHDGSVYGLVEPAYEQARVLARRLAGEPASYRGSLLATNLKVSGIGVFSAGAFEAHEGAQTIVLRDRATGLYRKFVIRDGRLIGCVLVGDTQGALFYLRLIRSGQDISAIRSELPFGEPYCLAEAPEMRRDVDQPGPPMPPAAIRTTCPYCGVGCGVLATPDGRGGAAIAGDPSHPANLGRLCSKGAALGETLGLGSRVLHPLRRTASGSYERVGWEAALDAVADGLKSVIATHGPDAVAFYLSGQLLTEDYYLANKLMKGFIGSPHVDTNSRLCMASTVAGQRRVFGSDTVPGSYEDLDSADLIVLVGSNAAWCHPVLFRRMQQNRAQRGARIVVIDPRATATSEDVDQVLRLAPGSDTLLFAGLLVQVADRGLTDADYLARHVEGYEAALTNARAIAPSLEAVARGTGLDATEIAAFYALWSETPAVVTAWSQGVNQSAQGTDKVAAILHCHLATGRIGKPGCGPFSLTGQPNAMGGREVGGWPTCWPPIWATPRRDRPRPALLERAPDGAGRGAEGRRDDGCRRGRRIRALWVMATNPAVSLPRADRVRAALGGLDLFVVSENVLSNDTLAARPHLILPAAAWGEKDGTVTNSERRISRQRAFLPLPGEVSRTGGSSRRSRNAWASATPSPMPARPRSMPSTPRSRPSRTRAAAISTSAPMPG